MWDIEERCSCDNCAYHHDCTRKIDHDIVQLYAPSFAHISTLPKVLVCTEYYPAKWCVCTSGSVGKDLMPIGKAICRHGGVTY